MELVVQERRVEAEDVISLLLARTDGTELPSWTPGAHIDLIFDGGSMIRQYSLSSRPEDVGAWRLGVLKEVDGRGGSKRVFDDLWPGAVVHASEPRNNFELEPAAEYLFIAGGIGITPILPMVRAAELARSNWSLFYGGRTRASMAFLDELSRYGNRVTFVPQDEQGLLDLESVLSDLGDRRLVYACGPESMLTAVETVMAEHGRSAGSLRVERFRPKDQSAEESQEFTVEFVASGVSLDIPADRSILDVAIQAGLPVFSSCQEGTCGTCVTTIIEGRAAHRDSLLNKEEQERQDVMCICVSRAEPRCDILRLDL